MKRIHKCIRAGVAAAVLLIGIWGPEIQEVRASDPDSPGALIFNCKFKNALFRKAQSVHAVLCLSRGSCVREFTVSSGKDVIFSGGYRAGDVEDYTVVQGVSLGRRNEPPPVLRVRHNRQLPGVAEAILTMGEREKTGECTVEFR